MTEADLKNRFTYHSLKDGQPQTYSTLRIMTLHLATAINNNTPDGREKDLAITHLEQAIMWAKAGIARL